MTNITVPGGALFAKVDERILSGLLLPWGELSRQSPTTAPIVFERGTVSLPKDLAIVTANVDHDYFTQVARASELTDTEQGLVATFTVAATDEGDELLRRVSEGSVTALSAELKNLVRDGIKAVSAVLTGAAFVPEGAFASAALFSIVEVEETQDELIARLEAELAAAKATPEIPAPAPVAVSPALTATTQEEDVSVATVPNTLAPVTTTDVVPTGASLHTVANALAAFSKSGDRSLIDALAPSEKPLGEVAMFALNDIKITTAGSVGVNIVQPQWIGELWRGREYERRIIPLLGAPVPLTSFKVKGFRWLVEPVMASWAGDKAAVSSNAPTTEPYDLTAQRWAGGHDIAREYRDFDVPEFWMAYFRAMTNSYAKLTDDAALAALIAGATPVVAGAVPVGVNSGLVSIVDGALAVLDSGAPSFAVVAKDVYRSIALMKDIDKLAFLNTSLGLEEGTITSFRAVPHPGMAAGKTLVGVAAAATYYELPGSPIRTEALDQIKGGIDEALFGYSATGVNKPAALALVTPAP